MRVNITANTCTIDNDVYLNAGEYNINKFYFTFSEEYLDEYVKEALFIDKDGTPIKMVIANNECDIPYDILKNPGTYTFGVYAYEMDENHKLILRYSPEPTHFYVNKGSYIEGGTSPTDPTPDEFAQYYQAMQDLIANAKPELIDYIDDNLPTIDVRETTTLAPGTPATVTNVGTERNPIFDFGIPQGAPGTTDYNELVNKPDLTVFALITESANKIALEMDTTEFKIKAKIFDKNNRLISESNVIDLPLESVVVSGEYDAANKKIILTLENGNVIEIPVEDLIDGLATKTELEEGLATKDANIIESISKNGTPLPVNANKNVNITVPTKTSEVINDSGFITNDTNGLSHYYNKTAADTRFSLVTETGSNFTLSIDPATFVMTATLKDKNGRALSTQTVDLPLESVVVGGRYDSETREVVLTLENGSVVRFSVADLVSGLQSEITDSNKLSSDLVDDTNSINKFVTTEEKTQIITNENDISDIKDEQEIQNEHLDELDMIYNAFPTVSDEDTTIQLDNTAKVKFREIDLKGNTSQVVIPEEQGTSVSNTSIYVSDVNTDKENTIEMSGNTYQANAILPSEYTQVDYIESDGNQYIDTGVNPTDTTNIETKVKINDITQNRNYVCGCYSTNTTNRFQISFLGDVANYNLMWCRGTQVTRALLTLDVNNIYEIKTNGDTLTINNQQVIASGTFDTQSKSIYLFGNNSNGTVSSLANGEKIYYFKIYNNNVLVRDFIPCFRNTDNEVGLYDLINNVFYTNQGTGVFTYGSVSSIPNPSYPQNIEVVTGTQNVEVCGKNLNNGIDYKFYIGTTGTTYRVSGNDKGLCIEVNGESSYTISTTTTQNRYRVACCNSLPTTTEQRCYNGTNKDGTSNNITINTSGYKYLLVNATDLTAIQIEKGSTATPYEAYQRTTYPVNLGNIELCKIGDYQDRIYKQNDKWYLYKETGKVVLNGSESWSSVGTATSGKTQWQLYISNLKQVFSTSELGKIICDKYTTITAGGGVGTYNNIQGISVNANSNQIRIYDYTYNTSLDNYKTWLSTHNTTVYYALATQTTTEITDTTLVNQLNALYNATIYPITNINTDTSNLLPYIDLHYNFVTPSPSPSKPSVVNVVKGNNTITISNSDNTESQNYPINLGDMELCKIETYQDYIYENNGNWFKKGNIGKVVLNGSEENWARGTIQDYYRYTLSLDTLVSADAVLIYSNYYRGITYNNRNSDYFNTIYANGNIGINTNVASTLTEWKSWLSNNNLLVYYVLNTPTDTQITDTTLITQLNNIKKAYSYDTQTNISQTNTDKPFIIYAEAIDNNADLLTNYVKKTDYASSSKGGVIKASTINATTVGATGNLGSEVKTYVQYQSAHNYMFIGKGTLENVIEGKGLVSNTDYATVNTAGVIKPNPSQYGTNISPTTGTLYGSTIAYNVYQNKLDGYLISKGTLENVIEGKDLTTKAYVDGLVGDVESLLETLDVGSGV